MNQPMQELIQNWESMIGQKIDNPCEFLEGTKDCKAETPIKQDMGECYELGYYSQKAIDNIFFGNAS